MNISVGQGVRFLVNDHGRLLHREGVVVSTKDSQIEVYGVYPMRMMFQNSLVQQHFAYDAVGAVYERDKDHVRLKDSPPPFSALAQGMKGNAGAFVDANHQYVIPEVEFSKCHLQVLDQGAKILQRDMRAIQYHPWPQELQKEKKLDRGQMAESRFGCLFSDAQSFEDDMQLG